MASATIEKMMPLYNEIEEICKSVYRSGEKTTAFELCRQLMDIPGLPMHCPPHHFIMPALLLTVAAMETGMEEDRYLEMLSTAKDRALNVLGGFCGWYGSCGAAVGVGIFMSVYTGASPQKQAHWADCIRATAGALSDISSVDGPRCCKRNSFFALLSALDTANEVLGLHLEKPKRIVCPYYENNPVDCKKEKCPFYPAVRKTELRVPDRLKPENRDGKNCECMNREYLLKYKTGVVHWLKKENEKVAAGEPVCEVEVEKKIFSVTSPANGVMGEKLVAEEAEFSCMDVLGYILTDE